MRPTCVRCLARQIRQLIHRSAVTTNEGYQPDVSKNRPVPTPSSIRYGLAQPRASGELDDRPNTPPPITRSAGASGSTVFRAGPIVIDDTKPEVPGNIKLAERPEVKAWTDIGIPAAIVNRISEHYPHINALTPAQRAFLLSVFRGQDVFLRDDMGRGKTFAVVIAALTLVYRTLNRAMRRRTQAIPPGPRIIILVPTSHLAEQVQQHLAHLDPMSPSKPTTTESSSPLFARLQTPIESTSIPSLPSSPILLATDKEFAFYGNPPTPHLEIIFIDEPDTMLGPVPTRYMPAYQTQHHPINRHPPVMIKTINDLLDIGPGESSSSSSSKKFDQLALDFTRRRPVQTVWTSATIHSLVRRFAKTRGWVRAGDEVVDLDFTTLASDKQKSVREVAGRLPEGFEKIELAPGDLTPAIAVDPEHIALVIDPAIGDLSHLSSTLQKGKEGTIRPQAMSGSLPPVLLETLALLHTTSPPPPGQFALALPPEGTSLDELSHELGALSVPNLLLTPEALSLDLSEAPDLLVARRSAVTGLHLAKLHTIYLLSGLDVEGLSPNQRRIQQGLSGRFKFYDVVSGRLGRLGTNAAGQGDGSRQRVISLVMAGGEEERGLHEMFYGRQSEGVREQEEDSEGGTRKRGIGKWDLEGLKRSLESERRDESGETESSMKAVMA